MLLKLYSLQGRHRFGQMHLSILTVMFLPSELSFVCVEPRSLALNTTLLVSTAWTTADID